MWPVKRASRSSQREECRTAYVTCYRAESDFHFPKGFDLSQHDLLLCESIRKEKHTIVFLHWTSEDRAKAHEPIVQKVLGISHAQPIGPVVQVLTPKMPKWTENPVKVGKVLISLAAIFGAMSAIRDHFSELFSRPDVVVFASNSATRNYHLGDSLDIPLVVRNEARLGQANVRLKSASLRPLNAAGASRALQFDISDVPLLQAGQNVDVHVSGLAPAKAENEVEPVKFALEIGAEAKEGWLVPARSVIYRPYIVSVWPNHFWNVRLAQMGPTAAQIQIELWSGASYPNGVIGALTFEAAANPEPGGVVIMPRSIVHRAPITVTDADGSRTKVELQTEALQPFQKYSYSVSIAFQRKMTASEWNSLRSSMKVIFE
jgi:hypothetical protein